MQFLALNSLFYDQICNPSKNGMYVPRDWGGGDGVAWAPWDETTKTTKIKVYI